MHLYITLLFLCLFQLIRCQNTDDFADGNFNSNPQWKGDTSDFIVNEAKQLQLFKTGTGKSEILLLGSAIASNIHEWRVHVTLSFAPSSSNFCRVYLLSSSTELKESPDGIYLQLGEAGSSDAVRLKSQINGTITELGASNSGLIANGMNGNLKITFTQPNAWTVNYDASNSGNYTSLFSSNSEIVSTWNTLLGIRAEYTSSNAKKFYFDDIKFGAPQLDILPPTIVNYTVLNLNQLILNASEPLDKYASELLSNFHFSLETTLTNSAIDTVNSSAILLTFKDPLVNGSSFILTIQNMQDVAGNMSENLTLAIQILIAEDATTGDIIITEIMSDPTPSHGLPDAEYIEIYNRSNKYILLKNWQIWDAISARTIDSCWMFPHSYRILTDRKNSAAYPSSGTVYLFPSLNSEGDNVRLTTNYGEVMDIVPYLSTWYRNPSKSSGGWSLERKIIDHPCSDVSNWVASASEKGGTPGQVNSVLQNDYSAVSPQIQKTRISSEYSIEITLNSSIVLPDNSEEFLSFSPPIQLQKMVSETGDFSKFHLIFSEEIQPGIHYTYELKNATDCLGMATTLHHNFVLGFEPDSGDLVINELLFHASPLMDEFVEVYNSSEKPIDLFNLSIEKLNTNSANTAIQCTEHYTLFPNDYVIFTDDSSTIYSNAQSVGSGKFYQLNLPSLNNDSNTVLLKYEDLQLDAVSYSADWHVPLLDDFEDKSLERISATGNSNNSSNWHTAATIVGFCTPGLPNSQQIAQNTSKKIFGGGAVFSPDNDGFQDVLQLHYELPEHGLIGTVRVFNEMGQAITTLISNDLLPVSGDIIWSGIDHQQRIVPTGNYIIALSAFHPEGKISVQERCVTSCVGKLK